MSEFDKLREELAEPSDNNVIQKHRRILLAIIRVVENLDKRLNDLENRRKYE